MHHLFISMFVYKNVQVDYYDYKLEKYYIFRKNI